MKNSLKITLLSLLCATLTGLEAAPKKRRFHQNKRWKDKQLEKALFRATEAAAAEKDVKSAAQPATAAAASDPAPASAAARPEYDTKHRAHVQSAAQSLSPEILMTMVKTVHIPQVAATFKELGLQEQVHDPFQQARNNKKVVDKLVLTLQINDADIIELLKAAHAINSPLLAQAFARRLIKKEYATFNVINSSKNPWEQIATLGFSDDIKRVIAQQAAFRDWGAGSYGQIDKELGLPKLTSITLEDLNAYNMISKAYRQQHPELFENKEARQKLFIEAISKSMAGLVKAFIRLEDTDKNAALIATISRTRKEGVWDDFDEERLIADLIHAGANCAVANNIFAQSNNERLAYLKEVTEKLAKEKDAKK